MQIHGDRRRCRLCKHIYQRRIATKHEIIGCPFRAGQTLASIAESQERARGNELQQATLPTIPFEAEPAGDAQDFQAPAYFDHLDILEVAPSQTGEFTDHSATENSSEAESSLSEEKDKEYLDRAINFGRDSDADEDREIQEPQAKPGESLRSAFMEVLLSAGVEVEDDIDSFTGNFFFRCVPKYC